MDKEKTKSVVNFLETLENDEDVQHVYANLDAEGDILQKNSTW